MKKKRERKKAGRGARWEEESLLMAEMGEDDSEVGTTFSREPGRWEGRGVERGCRIWGGISVENKVD